MYDDNGNGLATIPPATPSIARRKTVMGELADRYSMDPAKLLDTIKATCIKGNASNEQVQAFLIVANRYGLDPFLKEIHAFAGQGGGIVPIVGIDGWSKLANSSGKFDGCEFAFEGTGDDLACTVTIYIKDRSHPVRVTEYLRECKRNTPPWNTYTRRMLRHKTFMQGVRLAFGLGGVYDEDEARDIIINSDGAPAPTKLREQIDAGKAARAALPETQLPDEEAERVIAQKAAQARQQRSSPAEPPAADPESGAQAGGDLEPGEVPEGEATQDEPGEDALKRTDWINDLILVNKPQTFSATAARKAFHAKDVNDWPNLPRERRLEKLAALKDGTIWK